MILWITPRYPYPPRDGGRYASAKLITLLQGIGAQVQCLSFTIQEPLDEAVLKKGDILFPLPLSRFPKGSILKIITYPLSFLRFTDRSATNALLKYLLTISAEITEIVFDSPHTATFLLEKRNLLTFRQIFKGKLFYRAQNVESMIWERRSRLCKNSFLKLFYRWEGARIKKIEKRVCSLVDTVFAISTEDKEGLQKLSPKTSISVVPLSFPFINQFREAPNRAHLLFLGRLDWAPNKEGLIWFLHHVWPEVTSKAELSLTIAGSGNGSYLPPLISNLKRVSFLKEVENVATLYSPGTVLITPVFFGSGTRTKIIEAANFVSPTLSTSLGVEGLPLEAGIEYFEANSAKEWVASLINLSLLQIIEVGERAFTKLKASFSDEVVMNKLHVYFK